MKWNREAFERLAFIVQARMDALGIKQVQLAEQTKLSVATIRGLRYGKNEPLRETKDALEKALLWEPGSIVAILNGGEATPLTPQDAQAAPAAESGRASGDLDAMEAELDMWLRVVRRDRETLLPETLRAVRAVIEDASGAPSP